MAQALWCLLLLPAVGLADGWTVWPPYAERFGREEGVLYYEARTFVENGTGSFAFFKMTCTFTADGGKAQPVTHSQFSALDAGQGVQLTIRLPVKAAKNGGLAVRLTDRVDPAKVLFEESYKVGAVFRPLTITLLRPSYRDTIFATQPLKTIEFRIDLNDETLAGKEATIRFVRKGADDALYHEVTKLESGMTREAAAADLLEGEHILSVALKDGATVEKVVRKLPKLEGEAWIDEHLVLHVDGKPFLPFGWFSCPEEDFPLIAKQGCTAVQDYNARYRAREGKLKPYLDEVHAAGLKVCFYPYPTKPFYDAPQWGKPLSKEEAEEIRQYVRKYKTHPAVFAWYMADEPELRPALAERCKQIYDVVAAEDPYHPCLMLNDTIAGIHKYVSGGDILMPDPYPLFLSGGHAVRPIGKVSEFLAAVHEATGRRKPAWITPQAFRSSHKKNRAPNFTELRNMTYQALARNVKGFLWYTYRTTKNFPEVGTGMPHIVKEVTAIKEAVLAPPADVEIKISPETAQIQCGMRRVDDWVYLFAVNTATEPADVTFTVSGLKGASLLVGSEGREVAVADGTFTDRFELYDAHLYTNDPCVKSLKPITEIKKEIAAAVAALKKPGNLAFQDTGTEVSCSSASRYSSHPRQVNDGNERGMGWRDGTPRKYPDWLQLTFKEPQKIARVLIFTDCVRDCRIQVKDGEDWKTAADVKGNEADKIEQTFEPVTTDAIRIFITASNDEMFSRISEIEVYEK